MLSIPAIVLRCLLVVTLVVSAIGRPAQALSAELVAARMAQGCAMQAMQAMHHADASAAGHAMHKHDAISGGERGCCECGKRCDCDAGSPVSFLLTGTPSLQAAPAAALLPVPSVSFDAGTRASLLRPPIV